MDYNKTPKSQIDAVGEYNKKFTKTLTIRLNKKTDAKIIDYIDSLDNKAGTVKRLILQEMERIEKEKNK